MARIPDSVVDSVRSAVDLVDLVGDYVRLKKQGHRFVGLCPFHNEKTPSFSVDARQDLYYCFGCKRGGDLFKFVEEMEGVGFLDAVRLLAARAGVEVSEDGGPNPEADEREAMHAALRFAAKFFFDHLKGSAGKRGLDFLTERGFSKESITAFGVGYAPDSWDALLVAATNAQYKPELLEKVGLVKRRGSGEGSYDVFRDRVMFPIVSPVGKVLGFGGRIIPGGRQDGEFEAAKYVNSAETPVYHKSSVLFGLKQAKADIRGREEAILVEGYTDVISLHQAGVKNVVASSGTALASQQAALLARYARTVVLLFDADAAGVAAALKAIEIILAEGLAVFVVQLPDGADPDSFVRKFGAEAFKKVLQEDRVDFVSFYVDHARRSGRLDSGEGKGAVAEALMRVVARIEDPVAKEHYILRSAAELGVPDAILRTQYADASRSRRMEERKPTPKFRRLDDAEAPPLADRKAFVMKPEEESLLRLMLEHGLPMVEHILMKTGVEEFSDGLVRRFVQNVIDQYREGVVDHEAFLRGDLGTEIQRLAAELLSERHVSRYRDLNKDTVELVLNAHPFEAANSAMKLLKLDRVDEAMESQKHRIFLADQAGEDLTPFQSELQSLHALRRQIQRGEFLEWNMEAAE